MARISHGLRGAFAALVLSGASAGPACGAIVIDAFDSTSLAWPMVVSTDGPLVSAPVADGSRAIGLGFYTMEVDGLDAAELRIAPAAGLMDYRSSAGASGSVLLAYGSSLFPGSGLNLDATGHTDIAIQFTAVDLGHGVPLTIFYEITAAGAVTLEDVTVTANGEQLVLLPFGPGVDTSDIDEIRLRIASPAGTDFRVASISLVPEPASLGLIVLGASLILPRRLRA